MRSTHTAALCLVAALSGLVPTAAAAYDVYLKDGSVLDARAKYQVQNGRAIITLRNGGTVTFLALDKIDVARTEAANKVDYGGAKVMNTPTEPTAPPDARRPGGLGALIARRGPSLPPPPTVASPRAMAKEGQALAPLKGAKTAGGFLDLSALPRKPLSNLDISTAAQETFRGQGVTDLKVQAGTRADRVFLEVSTNSEGSVFQALETAAATLLRLRERFPGKVAALELLMASPSGERAGQFVITPELASALAGKKVETSTFFLDNVQF